MSDTEIPYAAAAEAAYEAHRGDRHDWPAWSELGDDGKARWGRTVRVAVKTFNKRRREERKGSGPAIPPIPDQALEDLAAVYDEAGREIWTGIWRRATTTPLQRGTMLRKLAEARR